jgi:hypothetical protein
MAKVNESYGKLQAGYLFPEIGRRVRAFQESHPDAAIIRLGIGDVTLPLAAAVADAMRAAVDEMTTPEGFADTVRTRATTFCSTRSASTTTWPAASRSPARRSSPPTEASRTAGTSRRSSVETAGSRSPIRSIRSTWTPT